MPEWLSTFLQNNYFSIATVVISIFLSVFTATFASQAKRAFDDRVEAQKMLRSLVGLYESISRHYTKSAARLVSRMDNIDKTTLLKAPWLGSSISSLASFSKLYSGQVARGITQLELLIRNSGFDLQNVIDKVDTNDSYTKEIVVVIRAFIFIAAISNESAKRIEDYANGKAGITFGEIKSMFTSGENFLSAKLDKEIDLQDCKVTQGLIENIASKYINGSNEDALRQSLIDYAKPNYV